MSLYEKATLVQIPSGYKASSAKLYSVLPSDGDGDFTVDVDADATRVNSDGLIESVSADQARLDYDPSNPQDPHLLLEPSRTNSLPESENFSTNWIAVGSTVSSGISSPDGGTNAYSLIEGTASGGKIIYDTISVSAGSVTYSLFMKKGDKRYTALLLSGVVATSMFNVDLENGTGTTVTGSFDSTSIEEYPNGWYRISVTATATAGNLNCNVYLMNGATYNDRNYTGNGTDKTYIFGAQLEEGSYPTSYIPTEGSAVTRTNDLISNSYTGLTSASGTIFLDLDTKGLDSNYSKIIALRDTVTGDTIRFEPFQSGSAFILGIFGLNGANVLPPFPNEATLPINNRTKIAFTFSGSNFKFIQDGGSVITGTYTGTPRQYNQIGGANITGGAMHNGIIHQLMVFDEALSDAELITLTS